MNELTLFLADSEATEQLGAQLGQYAPAGSVLYLLGELGAGKTTLVRGFLQSLGHQGAVKSPTYTLVEPYDLMGRRFYHFDLYRLGSPEELEYLGIRDYFDGDAVALIEWPERGRSMVPPPDLTIELVYREKGRNVRLVASSPSGEQLLSQMERG